MYCRITSTQIVLRRGTSPRSCESVCQTLNGSREAIIDLHQIWYKGALPFGHYFIIGTSVRSALRRVHRTQMF